MSLATNQILQRKITLDPSQKELAQCNEIANCIVRYLDKYPNAADTVEGVMQWLAKQKYEETMGLVEVALQILVEEGYVSKTEMADGRILFRRLEGS
jgi:hypothetical protein